MHPAEYRLDETQAEIRNAMRDLCEHADDTVWLTQSETMFERLCYLYEVAGGDRDDLAKEWPEDFA